MFKLNAASFRLHTSNYGMLVTVLDVRLVVRRVIICFKTFLLCEIQLGGGVSLLTSWFSYSSRPEEAVSFSQFGSIAEIVPALVERKPEWVVRMFLIN